MRAQIQDKDAAVVQYFRMVHAIAIHEAAMLIGKRARRPDLQARHAAKRAACESMRVKLGELIGEGWMR